MLADLYAFETANDPDGSVKGGTPGPDSDVTDVARFEGGYAVSDAGGNSVLLVRKKKPIKVLSVFEGVDVDAAAAGGPAAEPVHRAVRADRGDQVPGRRRAATTPCS